MILKYWTTGEELKEHSTALSNTPVYLAKEIDAIPKLHLTDEEMMQLASLLGVVIWIRTAQLFPEESPEGFVAMIRQCDVTFCRAQMETARKLGAKFLRYMRENKLEPATWPMDEGGRQESFSDEWIEDNNSRR